MIIYRRFCTLAIIFVVIVAFANPVLAQSTGVVEGQVLDEETGSPLPGVNILLLGADVGTATDSIGQFRIPDVPVGPDTLRAQFVGYRPVERTVTIEAGDATHVPLSLHPETVEMQGIEVAALRPSIEPKGELESDRIREAEVADPGALLRNLPGVGAVRRGAMGLDPNVRGLSETEVGVYVGGMRTFPAGPARMDSPMSHIDPSTIASLEVVKGPYALTWGPSNMSAIRVTQRGQDPPRTPVTGSIRTGYDTNHQSIETTVFAMGRQGPVSYSTNGAWRRGHDFAAGDGETVPGDYTSAEGRARVGVALSDHSTLSLNGSYQDQNDIDYPGRLLNALLFETGMGQLAYDFYRDTGLLRSVEVRASAQQTLHDMTNRGKPTYEAGSLPNGMDRPPLRIGVASEIQSFTGRAATDLSLGTDRRVTLGVDIVHTFRNATRSLEAVMEDGSRVIPPFYRTEDGEVLNNAWPGVTVTQEGVFVEVSRPLGPISVTGATRLDLAQSDARNPSGPFLDHAGVTASDLAQEDVMLNGSLTASIPLSEQWTLSLGGGSVARPPNALERYSDRFPASKSQTSAEFQGRPSLSPERSTQGDLWLDGRGTVWAVGVNGFARRIDDYITLEPTEIDPILPLSPSTVYRYTNGEATFFGAEVTASVAPTEQLTVRTAGSYLWGRDEAVDEPAFGVSPPSADLGVRWQPAVSLPPTSNMYLDATVTLVAEQTRVATTRGEEATGSYTTVDLGAGAQIMERVDLELGVENLFDVTYTNHLNAKNPFSGAQIPEPGRVFTTNLAVRF